MVSFREPKYVRGVGYGRCFCRTGSGVLLRGTEVHNVTRWWKVNEFVLGGGLMSVLHIPERSPGPGWSAPDPGVVPADHHGRGVGLHAENGSIRWQSGGHRASPCWETGLLQKFSGGFRILFLSPLGGGGFQPTSKQRQTQPAAPSQLGPPLSPAGPV